MTDQLNNVFIEELPCSTYDNQLLDVEEYIQHIDLLLELLKTEKDVCRYDLLSLVEIEYEIRLLHELKNSTQRLNRIIKKYHKGRK